jgi:hypothetical protein
MMYAEEGWGTAGQAKPITVGTLPGCKAESWRMGYRILFPDKPGGVIPWYSFLPGPSSGKDVLNTSQPSEFGGIEFTDQNQVTWLRPTQGAIRVVSAVAGGSLSQPLGTYKTDPASACS